VIRIAAAVAAFALAAGGAIAEDRKSEKAARAQERSAVCATQADDRRLRGATRGAWMKQCVRGGTTPQIAARQEKILECTEAADEDPSLAARERRRVMAECLRG
jgi:hypothetical protein